MIKFFKNIVKQNFCKHNYVKTKEEWFGSDPFVSDHTYSDDGLHILNYYKCSKCLKNAQDLVTNIDILLNMFQLNGHLLDYGLDKRLRKKKKIDLNKIYQIPTNSNEF